MEETLSKHQDHDRMLHRVHNLPPDISPPPLPRDRPAPTSGGPAEVAMKI